VVIYTYISDVQNMEWCCLPELACYCTALTAALYFCTTLPLWQNDNSYWQ